MLFDGSRAVVDSPAVAADACVWGDLAFHRSFTIGCELAGVLEPVQLFSFEPGRFLKPVGHAKEPIPVGPDMIPRKPMVPNRVKKTFKKMKKKLVSRFSLQ